MIKNGILEFNVGNTLKHYELTIYNLQGKAIQTFSNNGHPQHRIKAPLNSGIYLASINTASGKTFSRKFIVD